MRNLQMPLIGGVVLGLAMVSATGVQAKTVNVTMKAVESQIPIDNKGTLYAAWTFDGAIPGNLVRVTEGDTVDFTLNNPAENKNSHSMDFHAAEVDVLTEFAPVKPGESKHFKFVAKRTGLYMYHCGASPMVQHIARGMYGLIIVDPKEGYTKNFPKPDREYVIAQQQYFPDAENYNAMLENQGWTNALINGKVFNYDPVHDPKATQALVAKPGERVRIYFVNANVNLPVALHPIAGIWDRIYINGNPKNELRDIATYSVAVSEAVIADIVAPADHPTNNAIVDHAMSAALRGAITVLMFTPDADPKSGKGDKMILR